MTKEYEPPGFYYLLRFMGWLGLVSAGILLVVAIATKDWAWVATALMTVGSSVGVFWSGHVLHSLGEIAWRLRGVE